ncbi:sensor of ECF-type sigma factor [Flavobacterium sp.]|uniref:sensor of ECF-type sigma factor n=1 Tax=Flavobacterium sp. TaxID=239 RepID=UPI0038FD1DBE
MKNKKLYILLVFFFTFYLNAQHQFNEKREQIKALKVAFITNELSLSPEEAAVFWPLYNAYDDKQNEIRRKKNKSFIDKKDYEAFENITEKEASSLLAKSELIEEEIYQNRKKFINRLKGVLPSKKILKYKKSEDNFNKKLLQQYREKNMK